MILLFHNFLHFAKLLNKKYGTHTESRILHLHKIFYSAWLYVLFHPQPVETFSVYSDYRALRDERIRIDIFHQSEYLYRLALIGKHYEYFYIVLAIPSHTIKHSHSAMRLFGDAIGNLFILFGKDEELYGLAGAVYDIIQYEADDKQGYKTEYYPSPVVEDEIAGADNDDVAYHNHAS